MSGGRWSRLAVRLWGRATGLQMMWLSVCGAQVGTPLRLKQQNTAEMWQLGFKALLLSVVFLGLVGGCLYGWRVWKRGQGITLRNAPDVQLESARRISQKTVLLTVRWQGRRYLLAENAGATRVIDSRVIEDTQQ
jgi:hypothetical protein